MGRSSSCFAAFGAFALLAGCVAKPTTEPAPVAAPQPPPVVGPPPVMLAPPPSTSWRDGDLTAGAWFYETGSARFLAAGGGAFTLRCDNAARRMLLEREGSAGEMIIRTTETERRFADIRAPLPVDDPFLDAMIFSRGRFLVETADGKLVIPAWPEPAKAVEDCRI